MAEDDNGGMTDFCRTVGPISMKLGMKRQMLKYYNVYVYDGPVMTLTYFPVRSA